MWGPGRSRGDKAATNLRGWSRCAVVAARCWGSRSGDGVGPSPTVPSEEPTTLYIFRPRLLVRYDSSLESKCSRIGMTARLRTQRRRTVRQSETFILGSYIKGRAKDGGMNTQFCRELRKAGGLIGLNWLCVCWQHARQYRSVLVLMLRIETAGGVKTTLLGLRPSPQRDAALILIGVFQTPTWRGYTRRVAP